MSPAEIGAHMYQTALVALYVSGPPLFVATLAGLVIAILQGVTSIQDQSLPLTVKIIAVMAVLIGFGAMLGQPLLALLDEALRVFPSATR